LSAIIPGDLRVSGTQSTENAEVFK
jgi:hypothetical protein